MTGLPTPMDALLGYSTLLAMWGALLLHWFFPLPSHVNPLTLWQRIADALSEKVNHQEDSQQQQRLSGALSFGVMWLTAAVLLVALAQLIWLPWLFNLLLLWFSLGWKPLIQQTQQIKKALTLDNKPSARALLATVLNRDTHNLSSVGIAKASCETLLIGYARRLMGVLFWYAIAGGIGAFLYTLAVSLSRCWPTRKQEYTQFGLPSAAIVVVMDWFPIRLFALLIASGHRFEPAIKAIRDSNQPWTANGSRWVLSATGAKFQLALGGPAIYSNQKISRPRLGGEISPSPLHLALLNQHLLQKAWVWLFLQSFIMWFAHGLL